MNARHLRLPCAAIVVTIPLLVAVSFGRPPTSAQAANGSASHETIRTAPSAGDSAGRAVSTQERTRRGIVVIERAGRPVALGFVLTGDGRILTSLSALGDGNGVDARYADGSVVNARVGHSDRIWDLALLVPQVGRWTEGLTAAASDPLRLGSQVRTFTQVRGRAAVASVLLRGRTDLMGGDGEVLRDALEISTRVPPTDFGAPLVDDQGQVLGIVARACAPSGDAGACRHVAYGAPTEAVRQFLRNAPANAIPPAPWLGIQAAAAVTPLARGVRVVGVHPESPASDAGLRGGDESAADLITSVDGVPVQSAEKLAEVVRTRAVGDKVDVIVLREGKFRVVPITLRASPTARAAGASRPTRQ